MARGASAAAGAAAAFADLGATKGQAIGAFGWDAAGAGFAAGAVAAASLAAALAYLRYAAPDPGIALAIAQMGALDFAPLAAAPIAAALVAQLGARSAGAEAYARAAVRP
jgi:hypothetical protein